MRCSVFNCNNHGENNKNCKNRENEFHCFLFPKEKNLRQIWVNFCRREDNYNISTARVCSEHFTEQDFSNKLEYDMGFSKRLTLKVGAYPTIYKETQCSGVKDIKHRKKVTADEGEIWEAAGIDEMDRDPLPTEEEEETEVYALNREIYRLKRKNAKLKRERSRDVQRREKAYLAEIEKLNEELMKAKFQIKNMEKKLGTIFTKGQIEKLKNGEKSHNWSEEDMSHSHALYTTGASTYIFLRRRKFPLPEVHTLQTWAQKADISSGIIVPIMEIEDS